MALASAATLVATSFQRPDARQIATFFLGAVFIESLRYIIVSPFFRQFVWRQTSLASRPETFSEKSTVHTSTSGRHIAFLALDVLLPVSFGVASLSHFSSLLAFERSGGMGCAFVVALGGISQQLGRLVASMIILVDMHRRLHKFELFGGVFWLVLGAAAAFADNALSTGSLQDFKPLNASFCLRNRLLAPAAVAFALYLVIQLYFIARLWTIFSGPQRQGFDIATDARMMRPIMLILFEALALIPSVTIVDAVGEFIPFSIGVLLVLAAFSAKSGLSFPEIQLQSEPVIDIVPRPWAPNPAPRTSVAPSWIPPTAPRANRDRQRLSMISDDLSIAAHPFAASALRDKTMLRTGYDSPDRRTSRISSGTGMTSTEEGVVQMIDYPRKPLAMRGQLVAASESSSPLPQTPWTHRRIATPDQLNSFAAEMDSKPLPPLYPSNGIPPPPLSARRPPPPELSVRSTIEDGPSSPDSGRIYGSDIIRMTSGSSYSPRDSIRRQTMDTMGTRSHLSYVSSHQTHDNFSSNYPRESYQTGHQTFGGSRQQSVRRGSMFDGKRKSSLRSKRTTAASLGQLDLPPVIPPPLPSILSPRPLPATPTDASMR